MSVCVQIEPNSSENESPHMKHHLSYFLRCASHRQERHTTGYYRGEVAPIHQLSNTSNSRFNLRSHRLPLGERGSPKTVVSVW